MEQHAANLYQNNDKEEAIAYLAKKLQQDLDHPDWILQLASYLVDTDQLPDAEALLLQAKTMFPDLAAIDYNLAVIYFQVGKIDQAQTYLQQITDPDLLTDIYYLQAKIAQQQNKLPQALAYVLTAVDHNPQLVDNYLLAGDLLVQLQDFKQAQHYYHLALQLDESAASWFKLALTQLVLADDRYKTSFAKSKQLDAKYFGEHQKQLADIERYLQIHKKEE
ncbi:tetratricopeptide repeat protein [Bombilactobacillus thymidiniphilus]|uniref:Tetratricopeptide repeat protein n=1 Tax=Bombilactobacillus thymidiniphilus TaxID=2923363 RepID=A0ABY4PDL7_9LACO|nr:tetratricopeptide repeat protein [Bombilactobacillus thymidiniphilus]UQS83774.1 tetratricopeptide repeat protein [Bombilactobacillus thymidiniphilus]